MTTYRPAVGERCRVSSGDFKDVVVTIKAITDTFAIFDSIQFECEQVRYLRDMSFQPLPNVELIVDQIRNAETRAEAIQVARGYFDDTMHFGEVVER